MIEMNDESFHSIHMELSLSSSIFPILVIGNLDSSLYIIIILFGLSS